jgi:hypothetical protein
MQRWMISFSDSDSSNQRSTQVILLSIFCRFQEGEFVQPVKDILPDEGVSVAQLGVWIFCFNFTISGLSEALFSRTRAKWEMPC